MHLPTRNNNFKGREAALSRESRCGRMKNAGDFLSSGTQIFIGGKESRKVRLRDLCRAIVWRGQQRKQQDGLQREEQVDRRAWCTCPPQGPQVLLRSWGWGWDWGWVWGGSCGAK